MWYEMQKYIFTQFIYAKVEIKSWIILYPETTQIFLQLSTYLVTKRSLLLF